MIIPRISFLDIFIRGTFFSILQISSNSLMESLLRGPHCPVLQYLPLITFDVCVFISSSLLITLLYHLIRQISDKSRKSYAWIVMLVPSPVLAVFPSKCQLNSVYLMLSIPLTAAFLITGLGRQSSRSDIVKSNKKRRWW